jgi:hypothetical protein
LPIILIADWGLELALQSAIRNPQSAIKGEFDLSATANFKRTLLKLIENQVVR